MQSVCDVKNCISDSLPQLCEIYKSFRWQSQRVAGRKLAQRSQWCHIPTSSTLLRQDGGWLVLLKMLYQNRGDSLCGNAPQQQQQHHHWAVFLFFEHMPHAGTGLLLPASESSQYFDPPLPLHHLTSSSWLSGHLPSRSTHLTQAEAWV